MWTGGTFTLGYGSIAIPKREGGKSKSHYTHRVSYALAHGVLPVGSVVMHTCDTPLCVNPAHLVLGTQGDNNRDRSTKGRDGREKPSIRKLTTDDVLVIRASSEPRSVLAQRYGVWVSHIRNIQVGKARKVS